MSLLQHHSSKASILRCSAFFRVQYSHPYMTVEKTIALTGWTFDDKVMSLLFNMLSGLVINFLQRSRCLLISCWLDISKLPSNHYGMLTCAESQNFQCLCHFFLNKWAMSKYITFLCQFYQLNRVYFQLIYVLQQYPNIIKFPINVLWLVHLYCKDHLSGF